MADLTLTLSIVATVISTILAILRYKDSRKTYKRKFQVEAKVKKPFTNLDIQIENRGIRPITLLEYEVIYGGEFNHYTVHQNRFEPAIRMEESDVFRFQIPRDNLMNAREMNGVKQTFGCRLYVRIRASQNKMQLSLVDINPSIITNQVLKRAIPYVSSDIFIGFDPMMSNPEKHIRRGSHLSSGKN